MKKAPGHCADRVPFKLGNLNCLSFETAHHVVVQRLGRPVTTGDDAADALERVLLVALFVGELKGSQVLHFLQFNGGFVVPEAKRIHEIFHRLTRNFFQ